MLSQLSPAQLLDKVLQDAPASQRQALLVRARQASQQRLALLEATRLGYVEQNREDEWQQQHSRITDTLAAIERVLATC